MGNYSLHCPINSQIIFISILQLPSLDWTRMIDLPSRVGEEGSSCSFIFLPSRSPAFSLFLTLCLHSCFVVLMLRQCRSNPSLLPSSFCHDLCLCWQPWFLVFGRQNLWHTYAGFSAIMCLSWISGCLIFLTNQSHNGMNWTRSWSILWLDKLILNTIEMKYTVNSDNILAKKNKKHPELERNKSKQLKPCVLWSYLDTVLIFQRV